MVNLFDLGFRIFIEKTVSFNRAARFATFGKDRGFDVAVEQIPLENNPDYCMYSVWYRPKKGK